VCCGIVVAHISISARSQMLLAGDRLCRPDQTNARRASRRWTQNVFISVTIHLPSPGDLGRGRNNNQTSQTFRQPTKMSVSLQSPDPPTVRTTGVTHTVIRHDLQTRCWSAVEPRHSVRLRVGTGIQESFSASHHVQRFFELVKARWPESSSFHHSSDTILFRITKYLAKILNRFCANC